MIALEPEPCCDFRVIQTTPDRVFLVDLDLGRRSVTNDAAAIVAWVQRHYPARRLIYRDSTKRWDEIVVGYDNAINFAPYFEYVPDDAVIQQSL